MAEPGGRRERGLGLERRVDARDVWGPKSSLEGMVGVREEHHQESPSSRLWLAMQWGRGAAVIPRQENGGG